MQAQLQGQWAPLPAPAVGAYMDGPRISGFALVGRSGWFEVSGLPGGLRAAT